MAYRFAAVALLAVSALVLCNASEDSKVLKLTTLNYDEYVNDGKVYFVKYFAPWCGHCKRLAPTWDELAAELKSNSDVAIAHVDCTTDKEVCERAEIRGYPTLYVVHNGERKEKFQGSREKENLKAFVLKQAEKLKAEA